MNQAIMTHHSVARMKSRCGTSKTASKRLAETALVYGACHHEVNGQLHRYFTRVTHQHDCIEGHNVRNLRAYGDKLYLFADTTLVTVLQLPSQFIPQVKRITENKKHSTSV